MSKMNVRYNKVLQEYEINCIGFFNSDFFTLIEIVDKSTQVYEAFKTCKANDDEMNMHEMSKLYNKLEMMRVALLKTGLNVQS